MSKIKDEVKTLQPTAERDPILSAKRKRAMVEYISIMFFVAFILVSLSLFSQNRTLKQQTNEDGKTSMSLQDKIGNLQDENRELRTLYAQAMFEKAQNAYKNHNAQDFFSSMKALKKYAEALNEEDLKEYNRLSRLLPAETEKTE